MIAYPFSVCDSILYRHLLVVYLLHYYSEFSFDMTWPEIGDRTDTFFLIRQHNYLCSDSLSLEF
jgi:hypothetical protein